MRNPKTRCVAWCAALMAVCSFANAQETTQPPADQARSAVSKAANLHLRCITDQNVTESTTRTCCDDPNCCSDKSRCANCELCQGSENGAGQADRAVIVCSKCRVAVRVNSDEEAEQAANEECPFCVGTEETFNVAGIDFPIEARETGNRCMCDLCTGVTGSPNIPRPLPGSVSFIGENARELAQQRDQLASELADYLTNGARDPAHVLEVLQMALETTADQAHQAARMYDPSKTFDVTVPVQPDVSTLHFEMAETRRMIIETQKDLQLMNESLRFLARHMQDPERTTIAPPLKSAGVSWDSRPTPSGPAVDSELDRIHRLQLEVERLQSQIRNNRPLPAARTAPRSSSEQRLATSWVNDGQLRPAAWESQPLRPAAQRQSPLRPAARVTQDVQWRRYYVGDLISHPVPSSTFRLMQHIKSKIDPGSWQDEAIQIVAPSVSLMILQTPANHQRIETMLRDMGGMLK